jgi:hypothetical protein
MTIPPVGLLWGEARGSGLARFWLASTVASDDGIPWGIVVETNDFAPAGLGGEAVFTMAYLTVRAAAGAQLRVTPIIDDAQALTQTVEGMTVTVRQPTVAVPQQAGTPPVLVTQTFELPLLLQMTRDGTDLGVTHPRGERCRLRIESVGPIGTGAFRVEQCELEHGIVRRSEFSPFTA